MPRNPDELLGLGRASKNAELFAPTLGAAGLGAIRDAVAPAAYAAESAVA